MGKPTEGNENYMLERSQIGAVKRLQSMLKIYRPQIVLFTETKLSATKKEFVRKNFGFVNGVDV